MLADGVVMNTFIFGGSGRRDMRGSRGADLPHVGRGQVVGILRDTTRESVMILTIIAAAVLFGYMLTSLYLTQTLAQAIADMQVNRWLLMGMINVFLLVCGFFIPPAAIILMTAPILYPIIKAAGFDPVWFGVILTINMEIGLIHPPVGLNIYIVSSIAPDVPVTRIMLDTIPYVLCMMLQIVILCVFSGDRHLAARPLDGHNALELRSAPTVKVAKE
jgi:C4-dicarboxylate transporter, DctM subunit